MIRKLQKPDLFFLYALLGMSYFNTFSSIDLNPFLKIILAFVPIQLVALVCLFYVRYKKPLQDSNR
jgi:hypothetical protein